MSRFVAVAMMSLSAGAALAADPPDRPAWPSSAPTHWSWSGVYFGGHVGGGLGRSTIADPAGPGLYGGDVGTPGALAGLQAGANWQLDPTWVLGAELDASALNARGSNTCLASSGAFLSANCSIRQSAMATMTGRVGYAAGPGGTSLLYAKAGAAWLQQRIDIATNRLDPSIFGTSTSGSRWGWTVGAGLEQAIAPALSMKLEYDYANFGSAAIATPPSFALSPLLGYLPTPAGLANASQSTHTVKLGVNVNSVAMSMRASSRPPISSCAARSPPATPRARAATSRSAAGSGTPRAASRRTSAPPPTPPSTTFWCRG